MQNVAEAEYVVLAFQYMRLRGYPAQKISILTTYNGQKALIRDVIEQRCMHPAFGRPATVSFHALLEVVFCLGLKASLLMRALDSFTI